MRPDRLVVIAPLAALAALAALGGCVGPLVDDGVVDPALGQVLPKGTAPEEIPEIEEEPLLEAQILAHQGFTGNVVRQISAFADGHAVRFWDFGPAPAVAIPIFVLAEEIDADGFTPLDHPTIIDSIPGDPGYSPFWQVFLVPITDTWGGELVPSFGALQEARDAGLLGEPVRLDAYVNCPAVHRETKLETDDGYLEPVRFFYRGWRASYFAIGGMGALPESSNAVSAAAVYHLRREGGEPLDEVVRGVDMTGDGDLDDTNQVFAAREGDADYTPLARATELVVAADTGSIDTYQDEALSDVDGLDDLFDDDGDPRLPTVVAIYPQDALRNLPLAPQPEDDGGGGGY